MADPEFCIPNDTMSARFKSCLALLPRLQIRQNPFDRFTLFPRLPPELRNRIWKFAAFVPRTFRFEGCAGRSVGLEMPSILFTSKEARQEGLRYYKPVTEKSPNFRPRFIKVKYKRTIYINFEADWFVMHLSDSFRVEEFNIHLDDVRRIRNLTIYHTGYLPSGLNIRPPDFLGLLHCLPHIKQLTIAVWNWCAQVGVNQGIGQELWRDELLEKFRIYHLTMLKDSRRNPKLRILFADWNDPDTTPCSADVAKESGWRYFNPMKWNRYE